MKGVRLYRPRLHIDVLGIIEMTLNFGITHSEFITLRIGNIVLGTAMWRLVK